MRPQDWSIQIQANFTTANGSSNSIITLGVLEDGFSLTDINERVVRFSVPPSMTLNTTETRSHYGIPRQIGNERSSGTVSVTVRVDGAMEILDYFRQWQDLAAPDTNIETPTIGYYDLYAKDSTIQYKNEITGEVVKLEQVFPTEISQLEATHEPNATVLTADISFIYRTSRRITDEPAENAVTTRTSRPRSSNNNQTLISPYDIKVVRQAGSR